MLRFAEEIMLLLLDDEGGEFMRVSETSLQCALAGAVLMDLALENRIDTDLERLMLIDPTPVGDDLLDPTLARIGQTAETREWFQRFVDSDDRTVDEIETHDALYWVKRAAEDAGHIRETGLKRLVARGILEEQDDRFLWVFKSRRYPTIDGEAEREVKLRIMEVLFSDVIPDPRDIVIICLADVCGLFREMFSAREQENIAPRLKQVRKLDLIGQAVSQAIHEIEMGIAIAMRPIM